MSSWRDKIAAAEDPGELWDLATSVLNELDAMHAQLVKLQAAFEPVKHWYDGDGERDDFPAMLAEAVADLQHDRSECLRLEKLTKGEVYSPPIAAIQRLAGMIPNGNLMVATDPVAFLGVITDELCRLQAVAEKRKLLEQELATVTDLIDDVLYDPHWKPVDETGQPINGNAIYLLEHPVRQNHMPALREWFLNRWGGIRESTQNERIKRPAAKELPGENASLDRPG